MSALPILYANDTCPYVLRARLTLHYCDIKVEHREIAFSNKPEHMLQASPKGTVPTLVFSDGSVIDQSWEVMQWALLQNDPSNWVGENNVNLELAETIVDRNDNHFTDPSYYYRYSGQYPERNCEHDRDKAVTVIAPLEDLLGKNRYLGGDNMSIADIPAFPFIKAFAGIEPAWFATACPNLSRWLEQISNTELYADVTVAHEIWPIH